jgi:hypothetical protein
MGFRVEPSKSLLIIILMLPLRLKDRLQSQMEQHQAIIINNLSIILMLLQLRHHINRLNIYFIRILQQQGQDIRILFQDTLPSCRMPHRILDHIIITNNNKRLFTHKCPLIIIILRDRRQE